MGIKTILAALCCIQIVVIKASAVDKQNKLLPKIQEISQNSTAKLKNSTMPNEDSEYYEQYEDRFVDSFAMETTATEQIIEEVEEQVGKDAANNENNDGRSAYINNQFVSDEQLSHVNPTLPLYEVLQQQIEQVLAETEPEYLMYPPLQEDIKETNEHKNKTFETLNIYGNANEEDSEENTSAQAKKEEEDKDTKISNSFEPNQKSIVEIPKPLNDVNTTTASSLLHATQSEDTEKPYKKPTENCQLEIRPTTNVITSSDDIAQNSKRRNTYHIVSTSSQLVSTPLADLILKFSIGIAKPLRTTYFEDGKIAIGDGFKRTQLRGNKNRNAKYRIRKITSRPSKISVAG